MTPDQLDQPRQALYFDDLQPVRARRTDPQTSHDAASRAERFAASHAQAAVCCTHNCQQGSTCPVRTAYAELRMPNWPPTLAMTLQDPMRAAVIHARAAQLAAQQRRRLHQQGRAHGQCSTDTTPASQQGLVSWWRGLRLGARPQGTDHKRAAAGDRDD